MEFQLILVLIIAFIILGPERMMDLAFKMGEALKKVREVWDEIRMQAYVENINKSIMEGEQKELEGKEEDYESVPEELDEELLDDGFDEDFETEESLEEGTSEEEIKEDEREERPTSSDAPNGASEGAPKQAD